MYWDLKFNFTARVSFPLWQAPIQILYSIFDVSMPIWVMMLNIKTINYEKFLIELMHGWELGTYWKFITIYLIFKPSIDTEKVWLTTIEDSETYEDARVAQQNSSTFLFTSQDTSSGNNKSTAFMSNYIAISKLENQTQKIDRNSNEIKMHRPSFG